MKINRKEKHENNFNCDNQPLGFSSLKIFILLTFLLAILFLPLTSAVEVSMDSDFSQGETLLAVFSGNFVDQITSDDVYFYRGHVEIPLTHEVVKINDDFYVYALLTGKDPGNYSVRVQGVQYYKATEIVSDDLVANFTISNETAVFSINPGVLLTASGFSVELQNLKDSKITVTIDKDPKLMSSVSSVEINTGMSGTVSFTLDSAAASGLTNVVFTSGNTSYDMPVYLETSNPPQTENRTDSDTQKIFDMEFQPKTVLVTLATDSDTRKILYLKNTGSDSLEDISFSVSSALRPFVVVTTDSINSLEPGELAQVEINISSEATEKVLEGRVTAYTENVSTSFTLSLDFIDNFVPPESEAGEDPTVASLCEEDLNGIICRDTEECSGAVVQSKNGDCCILPLVCQEPSQGSSKKIIGWGLLVLVLIIVIWFFKRKYRRVQRIRPF